MIFWVTSGQKCKGTFVTRNSTYHLTWKDMKFSSSQQEEFIPVGNSEFSYVPK